MSQEEPQPQPGAARPQSPSPSVSSSSSSDEEEYTGPFKVQIRWDGVINAIRTAVREAFPSSPRPSSSSSSPSSSSSVSVSDAFRSYWYVVFTALAEKVEADESIPQHLTQPAVDKFNVTLYDESGAGDCPCCLPDMEAQVQLENEGGVAKRDLVRGIRNALYGGRKIKEDVVEGDEREQEDGNRLVFDAEWMMAPVQRPNGERYTHQFCYGEDADVVNIWVFWCSWESFKQNGRDKEKERKGEGKVTDEEDGERKGEAVVPGVKFLEKFARL